MAQAARCTPECRVRFDAEQQPIRFDTLHFPPVFLQHSSGDVQQLSRARCGSVMGNPETGPCGVKIMPFPHAERPIGRGLLHNKLRAISFERVFARLGWNPIAHVLGYPLP